MPKDMPTDLVEGAVPPPQLHVATWNNDILFEGVPTPHFPSQVITKYLDKSSQEISIQFKKIFEEAKQVGFNKEASEGGSSALPPAKRAKLGKSPTKTKQENTSGSSKDELASPMVSLSFDNLPRVVAAAIFPSTTESQTEIIVCVGGAVCLKCDPPASETQWYKGVIGTIIASWFKGKSPHVKNKDTGLEGGDVEFVLDDSSDYVYIGSKLTSVADAIDARAKEKPGSQLKVLYHDIKDDPRDDMPGHQKLIQKQRMVWKPEPSPVKV